MIVEVITDLRGKGKSRRNRQPNLSHFGKIRALSAEKFVHLRATICPGTKCEHVRMVPAVNRSRHRPLFTSLSFPSRDYHAVARHQTSSAHLGQDETAIPAMSAAEEQTLGPIWHLDE